MTVDLTRTRVHPNIQLQSLMEQVQRDWNALDDKREIEIMNRYARIMRTCTIAFIRKTKRCVYRARMHTEKRELSCR